MGPMVIQTLRRLLRSRSSGSASHPAPCAPARSGIPSPLDEAADSPPGDPLAPARSAIQAEPLDPARHAQLGDLAAAHGQPFLAYAAWKTAQALGDRSPHAAQRCAALREACPDLLSLNHNLYYRMHRLRRAIESGPGPLDVLDVGGGQGHLAAFLPPQTRYALVEPVSNGLSGIDLPFAPRTFDLVVACHVLEHVPIPDRGAFLDQLASRAKSALLLLNPFHIEETRVRDRLQLVIDITDASWAKEHLDCSLPHLSDVQQLAAERGWSAKAEAVGSSGMTLSQVFLDHFAGQSGAASEVERVHRFFNEHYLDLVDSERAPSAYLVTLGWAPEAQDLRSTPRQ